MVLRPNKLIDYVYFPEKGMVSLVLEVEKGRTIEVGLIGKEGMVGALAPLGATANSVEARVQMAGTACACPRTCCGRDRPESPSHGPVAALRAGAVRASFPVACLQQSAYGESTNGALVVDGARLCGWQ